MHKYNKIRGILRAKQGSQIPKFLLGGGNPYMLGNPQPSGILTATSSFNPSILNSNLYNLPEISKLDVPLTDFEQDLWNSRNGELSRTAINNTNFKIPEFVKTTPSFGLKLGFVGKELGKKIGNFANENLDLIIGGVNYLSNRLFGGTKNSSEYDTIIGSAKTLRNNLKGPAKWWATAGIAAVEGLNKIGASTVDDTYINQDFANKAGGSYTGTIALGEKAMANNGVEFGLFNRGGYRSAKRTRNNFLKQQGIATGIVNEASDLRAMIGDLNYLNYDFNINGTDPLTYRALSAKLGGTLDTKINLVKSRKFNQVVNVDTKLVEEFKEGGAFPHHVDNSSINYKVFEVNWEPVIEDLWEPIIEIPEFLEGGKLEKSSFEDWFNSIPENNRANQYDYKKAYEVFDWETLSKHAKDPENNHLYSVSPIADENGNYPFLKLGKIEDNPEIQGEFDWYNSEEGKEHKSKFDIEYINDRYYYVPKKFKEGGKTKEELETPEIEETSLKNLIPEGALHKNKHHMEHTEGLTLKGIPVIDNDGEQQAEIELDEIIFTLEVTKKLEELYKEGTDEAAIEAGKLLVKEILFNTDDRTGLIAKCLEGGKL